MTTIKLTATKTLVNGEPQGDAGDSSRYERVQIAAALKAFLFGKK